MRDEYYRIKLYRPALEQIGVRPLNPHACRHTFASLGERAGISSVMLQKILGHADYKTTKHYTHAEIDDLIKAMNSIEKTPEKIVTGTPLVHSKGV